MFKKIKNLLAMMLVALMVCAVPMTAYAEEITTDFIFTPDTGKLSTWKSASNGWHMTAYHETENDRNIILFESNSYYRTHYMIVDDENIEKRENGGLTCYGAVYDLSDLSYYGFLEVTWNAADFPEVYILYGDQFVTDYFTMAMADYEYTGTVTIN